MNEVFKKDENELLPLAEEFLKQTRLDLDDAKTSFFKIGFRLNEANRGGYFRALGYEDIYALALDEFGFEKTTTKNLMAINYKYCVHGTGSGYSLYSMQIAEKYRKYSQTQLVEMLPLMDSEREHVPEDFTISELRDYKKVCKNPTVYGISWTSYRKDPRASVKQYREKKAEEERNAQQGETIVFDGQMYFTDTGETAEFHQSGGELHALPVSQLTEEEETSELGEVLEECEEISEEESAADTMQRLRDKYALSNEAFAEAGRSFPAPSPAVKVPRHVFKNKAERESFIRDIKNFPVLVLHCEELQLTVRRCDLANGAKIYHTEYKEYHDWNKQTSTRERLCLIDVQEKAEGTGHNAGGTFSPKTYTLEGTAPTYIVDYMTKFKDEI